MVQLVWLGRPMPLSLPPGWLQRNTTTNERATGDDVLLLLLLLALWIVGVDLCLADESQILPRSVHHHHHHRHHRGNSHSSLEIQERVHSDEVAT